MRPPIRLCLLAIALGAVMAPTQAEELGTIRVESTTIDDRFDSKRAEPSSIGMISGETVDTSHVENIQQVLQGIAGVTTEVQGGDSIKIHFRGVENQVFMGERPGVAVVIDGVPVFERTGRVNIDLDNIESIKVVKGGASYLFGDDALAGAVIITTKRGAKRAGYHLGGEHGSYGYRKGLASAGFSDEKANGHVQVSSRQGEGYHDDSASRADYVDGKLQYYVSDSADLTFGFENAARKKNSHGTVTGVTAAENDPTSKNPAYNDYANRFDVRLAKYYLTYATDLASGANWMVNGYSFGDHTRFFSSPINNTSDYNYNNDYKQTQRGIKTEYRADGERLGWMVAADVRDNTYLNQVKFNNCTGLGAWAGCTLSGLKDDNETKERVKAAYGELKYRVAEPLVITLNGRYDQIALDYRDKLDGARSGDQTFHVASWRFGGNYAASERLDLYANASTGFRAPSVGQLFVGSSSPTTRVDPNPDLKPEHAINTELGVRAKMSWGALPVELDAAVFQLDRTDHIQATAGQYTTGAGNTYDNVGDMRHRGVEVTLRSDPVRTWSWDLAYTWLDAEFTKYDNFNLRTAPVAGACPAGTTAVTGGFPPTVQYCIESLDLAGNAVPRVPDHHANLAVRYRPATNWLVTAEVDAFSSYYADETNRVKIDGRETYNLLLNYDPTANKRKWSFFARVDNLLDDQYYNTARGFYDSNDDGVFDKEDISIVVNPGRTYTIGASVAF